MAADDNMLDMRRVERTGKFDDSTEKLILRFGNLKLGMSPKQVKALFPKHVNWDYFDADRNFSEEIGFQWQTEVAFVFIFRNPKPFAKGRRHEPDDMSDEWKLEAACVRRITVGVDDGSRVNLKHWETPWFYYDLANTHEAAEDKQATPDPAPKSSKSPTGTPQAVPSPRKTTYK